MDFVDVVTVPSQVYNRTHNVNVGLNVKKIKVFYFTEPKERKKIKEESENGQSSLPSMEKMRSSVLADKNGGPKMWSSC